MVDSTLTPGKDIDSRCTRCKVVIGHTIVVMDGPIPKRVKCNSCGSEHRFIPAPQEGKSQSKPSLRVRREEGRRKEVRVETAKPKKKPAAKTKTKAKGRAKKAATPPPSHADVFVSLTLERELVGETLYSPKATYAVDDLVSHKVFGLGLVLKVRDRKVDIHFRDQGPKVLVHTPE